MKKFEIWEQKSHGFDETMASHVVEAEKVLFENGAYVFRDTDNRILHAIVTAPGMFVRTVESRQRG